MRLVLPGKFRPNYRAEQFFLISTIIYANFSKTFIGKWTFFEIFFSILCRGLPYVDLHFSLINQVTPNKNVNSFFVIVFFFSIFEFFTLICRVFEAENQVFETKCRVFEGGIYICCFEWCLCKLDYGTFLAFSIKGLISRSKIPRSTIR